MNKKKLLLYAAAFAFLLFAANYMYQSLVTTHEGNNLATDDDNTEHAQQSNTISAPDFIVYDAEGNRVTLSDFRGKPVVVNFWASWCGPCKKEMPTFESLFQRMGNEIHFLMLNMTDGSRETLEKATTYIADSGYTFPVYYDTQFSAAISYGVSSLPTTYFIDADGNAVAQAIGTIDETTLLRGIDMIKP